MNCQGNAPCRTRASGVFVGALAGALSYTSPSHASSSVEVRCDQLTREQASAFEARAHAELLVRGQRGGVRLTCPPGMLEWHPERGPARSAAVTGLETDALLGALQELLAVNAPGGGAPPERHGPPLPEAAGHSAEPREIPFGEVRLGGAARIWDEHGALGATTGFGLRVKPLTLMTTGHLTRGLVSYGGVSLYMFEARLGAEFTGFDAVHLGFGVGGGRPFTLEPATVRSIGENSDVWFFEGQLRASVPLRWFDRVRFDVGAEVSLLSRPLRLRVDDTVWYDFAIQPGAFLEAAFELR
jgi:hypothetical protein